MSKVKTQQDQAGHTRQRDSELSAQERAVLARIKTQTRAKRPGWLRRLAKNPPVFFWWWMW